MKVVLRKQIKNLVLVGHARFLTANSSCDVEEDPDLRCTKDEQHPSQREPDSKRPIDLIEVALQNDPGLPKKIEVF